MDSKPMLFSAMFTIVVGLFNIQYHRIIGIIFIAIGLYLFYRIFKIKSK